MAEDSTLTASKAATVNTHVFPVPDFAWHTKSKKEDLLHMKSEQSSQNIVLINNIKYLLEKQRRL